MKLHTLLILSTLLVFIHVSACASTVSVKTITNGDNLSGENSNPLYVLFDSYCTLNGVLYFSVDGVIRKIDEKGLVKTVVGKIGTQGYNGDGLDGINTLITSVLLECDELTQTIYFIDRSNYLIRKLDKNGKVYNVAGIPTIPGNATETLSTSSFSQLDKIRKGPNGNLYIRDATNIKLISQQFDSVSIVLTDMDNIAGFAVSSLGDLYIGMYKRIAKYSHLQTDNIPVFLNEESPDDSIKYRDGPLESAYFSYIMGVNYLEGRNCIIVNDDRRVRLVDLNSNNVSSILEPGNGTNDNYETVSYKNMGQFFINACWFDTINNLLYFSSSDSYVVLRRLNFNTGMVEVVSGLQVGLQIGGSYQDTVVYPKYGAKLQVFKDGSFYAITNSAIIQFSNGTSSMIYKESDAILFNYNNHDKLRKLASSSKDFITFSKEYSDDQSFSYFKKISHDGKLGIDFTPAFPQDITLNNTNALNTNLGVVYSIGIDPTNGDLYYGTTVSLNRVRNGIITTVYNCYNRSRVFNGIVDIAFSPKTGEMYISDYYFISKFDKETFQITKLMGKPYDQKVTNDNYVAIAIHPFKDELYTLTSSLSNTLQIYNFKTKSITTFPDTKFSSAGSLAFDDSTGDLYIGDRSNCLVHILRANGTMSVFVGVQYNCQTSVGDLTSDTTIPAPYRIAYHNGNLIIVNGGGQSSDNVDNMVIIRNNYVSILATATNDYNDGNTLKTARFSVFNSPKFSPITGELYVVDGQGFTTTFTRRIRKIDIENELVSNIAGGLGEGYSANETAVCLSSFDFNQYYSGNFEFNSKDELIYFDMSMQVMRKIDSNNIVTTIAGNGKVNLNDKSDGIKATDFSLQNYQQVFTVCPDDSIYFCADKVIYKIGTNGILNKVYSLSFDFPIGANLTCTKYGTLLTFMDNTIYKVTETLDPIRSNITGELENLPIASMTVSFYTNTIYLTQLDGQVIKTIGCDQDYEMQDDFTTCLYVKCDIGCVNGECNLGKCNCQSGWTGESCQIPICFGETQDNACGGPTAGICKAPNTCNCINNYYGTNCSNFDCFGVSKDSQNVCSGNGKCTSPNKCSCFNDLVTRDEQCSQSQGLGATEIAIAVVIPIIALLSLIGIVVIIVIGFVIYSRRRKGKGIDIEMKP